MTGWCRLVSGKLFHQEPRLSAAGPLPRNDLPANAAAVDYSMLATKPPPWVPQTVPNGEMEGELDGASVLPQQPRCPGRHAGGDRCRRRAGEEAGARANASRWTASARILTAGIPRADGQSPQARPPAKGAARRGRQGGRASNRADIRRTRNDPCAASVRGRAGTADTQASIRRRCPAQAAARASAPAGPSPGSGHRSRLAPLRAHRYGRQDRGSAMSVRTRFAPPPPASCTSAAPAAALFNWLFARRHGGRFLLRIEDTDRQRSTQEAVEQILESLRWLGLDPDEPPVFQSTREERHREVAYALLAMGRAYRCYATPEELAEMRRTRPGRGPATPLRRPLARAAEPGPDQAGKPFAIRLKAPRRRRDRGAGPGAGRGASGECRAG